MGPEPTSRLSQWNGPSLTPDAAPSPTSDLSPTLSYRLKTLGIGDLSRENKPLAPSSDNHDHQEKTSAINTADVESSNQEFRKARKISRGLTPAKLCQEALDTALRQSLDPSELRKRWKVRRINLSDNRCNQRLVEAVLNNTDFIGQVLSNRTFMQRVLADPKFVEEVLGNQTFVANALANPKFVNDVLNKREFVNNAIDHEGWANWVIEPDKRYGAIGG